MTLSPPDVRSAGKDEDTVFLVRQRRKRRRRLILRITIPLLVLALIIAGIWVVGFSSVLAVQRTQVSGTSTLEVERVEQIADVPIGAPLARVDLEAVQARVAKISRIESVQVDRRWPDTVQIRVVERTPVFAVPQGQRALLVDRFGVAYLSVPVTKAAELPKVTIRDPELYEPLAEVASALPEKLTDRLARIEGNSRDSIELHLKDGRTVFWGSESESALKAKVAVVLLKQDGDYFDVSAPGSPAVR